MRTKRELITAHLENWNGAVRASIENYYESGKVSGTLLLAIEKIMQEYADQSRWIDVKERLPETNKVVLVYAVTGIFGCSNVAEVDEDGRWWKSATRVLIRITHWQPLPQPPERKEQG